MPHSFRTEISAGETQDRMMFGERNCAHPSFSLKYQFLHTFQTGRFPFTSEARLASTCYSLGSSPSFVHLHLNRPSDQLSARTPLASVGAELALPARRGIEAWTLLADERVCL